MSINHLYKFRRIKNKKAFIQVLKPKPVSIYNRLKSKQLSMHTPFKGYTINHYESYKKSTLRSTFFLPQALASSAHSICRSWTIFWANVLLCHAKNRAQSGKIGRQLAENRFRLQTSSRRERGFQLLIWQIGANFSPCNMKLSFYI